MGRNEYTITDYQALAEFRFEIRRFLNFVESVARREGIEPQQYQALLAICGLPPQHEPTVGRLAERMQIRHHSAVELSRRLERQGWIRRARNSEDRRKVLPALTPQGQHLLDKLSRAHRGELRTRAPRLIEALQAVVNAENARRKR